MKLIKLETAAVGTQQQQMLRVAEARKDGSSIYSDEENE